MMSPHIFIYLFLFYRQPHIFIFHLVCYISKCLRVETSFWTGGCTHTPAKCQSSYMRKKCIASNLITTCRILINKKKKNSLTCSVKEKGTSFQFLTFIFFFAYAILSFLNFIFCCSLFALVCLSRLVKRRERRKVLPTVNDYYYSAHRLSEYKTKQAVLEYSDILKREVPSFYLFSRSSFGMVLGLLWF